MTVEVPTKAEHEAVAKTAADALERSSSVAAAGSPRRRPTPTTAATRRRSGSSPRPATSC